MENKNIEETADKKPCPYCGKTDIYRAYIEDGSMGNWCPHCQRSIPKIEKPKVIEESPDKKQCPFCGKRVVHQACTEDGGMGDWCPLCKRSIPYITKADMTITTFLSIWIWSIMVVITIGTIGLFIVEFLRFAFLQRPSPP